MPPFRIVKSTQNVTDQPDETQGSEADISARLIVKAQAVVALQAPESEKPGELSAYLDRLTKLIPAEVIGLYLSIRGFLIIGHDPNKPDLLLAFWPLICLLLTVVVRIWGTGYMPPKDTQWSAVIIASVSFVIWVYVLGDSIMNLRLPDTRLAPVAMAVWTFIIPIFFKGSEK